VAGIARKRTIAVGPKQVWNVLADFGSSRNRWTDPDLDELRQHLRMQLKYARTNSIPSEPTVALRFSSAAKTPRSRIGRGRKRMRLPQRSR
jgi:hypothetical protein